MGECLLLRSDVLNTTLIHEGMGPLERCHFNVNFETLLQRAGDN